MNQTDAERRYRTREHLEEYFEHGCEDEIYAGHQPIYGFGGPSQSKHQIVFLARVHHILRILNRWSFETFLDVGGGEGYIAHLARTLFGCHAVTCDISYQANLRARGLYGLDSLVVDGERLPFEDEAFDLVLCSEVIEHLESPVRALRELLRVSRKGVIVSTMETAATRLERRLLLLLRDLDRPHAELNYWVPGDFRRILGAEHLVCAPLLNVREYAAAGYADERFTETTAQQLVGRMIDETGKASRMNRGLLVVKQKTAEMGPPRYDVTELLERHFAAKLPLHPPRYPARDWISPELARVLCCPVARTGLARVDGGLYSSGIEHLYRVAAGIPVMEPPATAGTPETTSLEREYQRLFSPAFRAVGKRERQVARGLLLLLDRWQSFRTTPTLRSKAQKVFRLLQGAAGQPASPAGS